MYYQIRTFLSKRKISAFFVILFSFLLTSCSSYLRGTPTQTSATGQGAMIGAGTGAAVATLTKTPFITQTLLGSGIGAVIGSFLGSSNAMVLAMYNGGVQFIQLGDNICILIPSDVVFRPQTDVIKRSAYPTLVAVTSLVKFYGDVPIHINGYTDNVRLANFNKTLSENQAKQISKFLWAYGINPKRLSVGGRGQLYDIASNLTSTGSSYNRRVVISFIQPPGWQPNREKFKESLLKANQYFNIHNKMASFYEINLMNYFGVSG